MTSKKKFSLSANGHQKCILSDSITNAPNNGHPYLISCSSDESDETSKCYDDVSNDSSYASVIVNSAVTASEDTGNHFWDDKSMDARVRAKAFDTDIRRTR